MLGLSAALLSIGSTDEALDTARAALDGYTATLGPDNPRTAIANAALGSLLVELEHYGRAAPYVEAAHASLVREYGPTNPETAYTHSSLGRLACARGQEAEASAHFLAATEVWTRELGPRHPKLAWVLRYQGNCWLKLGAPEAARESFQRGIELHDPNSGDPAHLASMEFGLARAQDTGVEACTRARSAHARFSSTRFTAARAEEVERWMAERCADDS